MNRSLLDVVVAVVLVLGASAVAIAATRNCTANTPCVGTSEGDTMPDMEMAAAREGASVQGGLTETAASAR